MPALLPPMGGGEGGRPGPPGLIESELSLGHDGSDRRGDSRKLERSAALVVTIPVGRVMRAAPSPDGGGRALARVASSAVLRQVGALLRIGTAAGLTDGSLLERFRSGTPDEAEAAFAALVERHGLMVMQV